MQATNRNCNCNCGCDASIPSLHAAPCMARGCVTHLIPTIQHSWSCHSSALLAHMITLHDVTGSSVSVLLFIACLLSWSCYRCIMARPVLFLSFGCFHRGSSAVTATLLDTQSCFLFMFSFSCLMFFLASYPCCLLSLSLRCIVYL